MIDTRYPLSKLLGVSIREDMNLIERELIEMPTSKFTKAVTRLVDFYREAMNELEAVSSRTEGQGAEKGAGL